MVNQIRIVSILMIIQGALATLMGLLFAAMGPVMMAMFKAAPPPQRGAEAPPEEFLTIVVVIYGVIGLLGLTAGILNIVGGIRGLKLRGRTFGMVALFSNVLPIFTFYCAPTSLGVMIYGLIVYFNRDVVKAFQLVAEGESPDRVVARFERRRRDEDWEDEEDEEDERREA